MASALLQRERLSGDELRRLLAPEASPSLEMA
jgi:hypothetical protein